MGLRKLDGCPQNPADDPFCQKLPKYRHDFGAVDERKHPDIFYLPVTTTIENLYQKILESLPEGSVEPSSSWLYMNF